MFRNKMKFALIFRAAALIFSVSGILSATGVFSGALNAGAFYYYTTQSNILAAVMFVLLTASTLGGAGKDKNACYFPRFSMICVIDILVTFFVFWFLLAPGTGGGLLTFANLSVHAVTPVLCLADYIMFTKPRHLKYRDVYAVIVFPLCYVVFATIAGFAGHTYGTGPDGAAVRFPYFFMDYDRLGALTAAYIAGLVVVFIILSHGFYLADSKIRKE